jgi:hypothetical protein
MRSSYQPGYLKERGCISMFYSPEQGNELVILGPWPHEQAQLSEEGQDGSPREQIVVVSRRAVNDDLVVRFKRDFQPTVACPQRLSPNLFSLCNGKGFPELHPPSEVREVVADVLAVVHSDLKDVRLDLQESLQSVKPAWGHRLGVGLVAHVENAAPSIPNGGKAINHVAHVPGM